MPFVLSLLLLLLKSSTLHMLESFRSCVFSGLFPSRNQLELLGAFLDNHTNSQQLKSFWLDTLARVHGEGVRAEAAYIDEQAFYRTSFVLEYFESIQHFADNLEEFLRQLRLKQEAERMTATAVGGEGGKKKKKRDRKHMQAGVEDPWGDDFEAMGSYPETGASYVEAVSDTTSIHSGPRTPLSVLFSVFRSSVELGDSGNGRGVYFIGDLDEKREQALILGDIPMTFKDRYTFCLAPVSVDNPEVMQAFRRMASHFARGRDVQLLGEKYEVFDDADSIEPPRSPEELLILETLHQVCLVWSGFYGICNLVVDI